MILPLANTADRTTQILWGIRDFQHRFSRSPEGMWLPETAVDLETLAIMADQGIAFTILSPSQAGRVRPLAKEKWTDVNDGSVNPRVPYVQRLADDRSIAVFFYDGPISRDVAFDGLLTDGEDFAARLTGAFEEGQPQNQLVHIATDGETFGHHHRFGDMALAYALEKIDASDSVRLTNYGEFLEANPPTSEVEIKENTAWSCAHGVGRWKDDCGCNSGQARGWSQRWREPLRNALDWLRDALADAYAAHAADLFEDPWRARNDYIEAILDRSPKNIDRFLGRHLTAGLDATVRTRALKLLEMQRQAMLMYTSCGWFFDELSGIETVQVIQYAGRAVQLAGELFERGIESPFLDKLAAAESNIPRYRNGRWVYENWVKPARVDLKKAAVHYAISSLFEDYPETVSIFCYALTRLESRSSEAGKAKIAVGRIRIASRITRESEQFQYAVLHMGDHSISCGIKKDDPDEYARMTAEVLGIFEKSDIPGVFRSFGHFFENSLYSIVSLFRDEQRKVLNSILAATTAEASMMYRQLYENHVALMRFINDSSTRIPRELYIAGEIVINNDLSLEFDRGRLDREAIRGLIDGAERAGIDLDAETLEYTLRGNLARMTRDLRERPEDLDRLEGLMQGIELTFELPFQVEFQEVRNIICEMGQNILPEQRKKAEDGHVAARPWMATFLRLAEMLKIRVD
jgi:hypothetical protein